MQRAGCGIPDAVVVRRANRDEPASVGGERNALYSLRGFEDVELLKCARVPEPDRLVVGSGYDGVTARGPRTVRDGKSVSLEHGDLTRTLTVQFEIPYHGLPVVSTRNDVQAVQ